MWLLLAVNSISSRS